MLPASLRPRDPGPDVLTNPSSRRNSSCLRDRNCIASGNWEIEQPSRPVVLQSVHLHNKGCLGEGGTLTKERKKKKKCILHARTRTPPLCPSYYSSHLPSSQPGGRLPPERGESEEDKEGPKKKRITFSLWHSSLTFSVSSPAPLCIALILHELPGLATSIALSCQLKFVA